VIRAVPTVAKPGDGIAGRPSSSLQRRQAASDARAVLCRVVLLRGEPTETVRPRHATPRCSDCTGVRLRFPPLFSGSSGAHLRKSRLGRGFAAPFSVLVLFSALSAASVTSSPFVLRLAPWASRPLRAGYGG
jgi:hypothetical protein